MFFKDITGRIIDRCVSIKGKSFFTKLSELARNAIGKAAIIESD